MSWIKSEKRLVGFLEPMQKLREELCFTQEEILEDEELES